jgi:antitoxin CptB
MPFPHVTKIMSRLLVFSFLLLMQLQETFIDLRAMSQLRWRCRRGLLENDLLLERFFKRYPQGLTHAQAQGLISLMDLSDPDLLDLFLSRTEPEGKLADAEVLRVLNQIRTA